MYAITEWRTRRHAKFWVCNQLDKFKCSESFDYSKGTRLELWSRKINNMNSSRISTLEQVLSLFNAPKDSSCLHDKEVPVPTPVILSKVINGVPIVNIVVCNSNFVMSLVVFQPACAPRPTFQFDVRLFFEQGYDFFCCCPHMQFMPSARFYSHIMNSNICTCTSNDAFKTPSSTIRRHVFQQTQPLYTRYNLPSSLNLQTGSFLTNTRANAWNARYHQGNGNIVVQHPVHLSKFQASAPS